MRNEKELLEHGNEAQYERLIDPKNNLKGDFPEKMSELYHYLQKEVIELKHEIEPKERNRSFIRIRDEAADVANFAHMIILSCDKRIKNGEL